MANNTTSGLLPAANDWFQNPGMGYYAGPTQSNFTDMQQQAWGSGQEAAGNIQGFGNQSMGNFMGGPQDVGVGGGMDMFNNPYLENSIQAGMQQNNQNFERNVMPAINQGFNSQPGSSRQGIAQGLAASDLNQQNLNMASQMNQQAYDQGMKNHLGQRQQNIGVLQGNQQNATNWMGMTPNMMTSYGNTQMAPYMMQAGIGQQQQDYANRNIQGEMNRWDYTRDQPYQRLNQYAGLINSTQGSQLPGYNPGPGPDYGAAATGIMDAASGVNWGSQPGYSNQPIYGGFDNAWDQGLNQPLGQYGG